MGTSPAWSVEVSFWISWLEPSHLRRHSHSLGWGVGEKDLLFSCGWLSSRKAVTSLVWIGLGMQTVFPEMLNSFARYGITKPEGSMWHDDIFAHGSEASKVDQVLEDAINRAKHYFKALRPKEKDPLPQIMFVVLPDTGV